MISRLLLALALVGAWALPARAQEMKPKPWTPGQHVEVAPAPPAAADTLRTAPADHPMPTPAGVTRSLDLLYQPSVPDSIVPLVPLYREVHTDELLSAYVGSLRQDLPVRPYPVVLGDQAVHATVDGLEGQSHLAIMLMVPWIGKILPWPYGKTKLVYKLDDAKEVTTEVMFTPGGNFYIPSQRPLPVSNPTLVTLPLAPGRHRITLKLKDLDPPYAFLLLGQPQLSPQAIAHPQ
jgi:hypothetical protein